MPMILRACLVLTVSWLASGCAKGDKEEPSESQTTAKPGDKRWEYFAKMLSETCRCQVAACFEKIQEGAKKAGHRALPAQLLDEDREHFDRQVAAHTDCNAELRGLLVERARSNLARMQLATITRGAHVRWTMETGKSCPESLSDLNSHRRNTSNKDPWGHELVMLCGEDVTESVNGFGVISLGPDGIRNSADDLRSWELE